MRNFLAKNLRRIYEILYAGGITAGLMILGDCYFQFLWSHILIVISAVVFQIMLQWSEEKKMRIQLWSGVAVLTLILGIFLYRIGNDLELYFFILIMESICLGISVISYVGRHRLWIKALLLIIQLFCLVFFSINGIDVAKWTIGVVLLCLLLFFAECVEVKTAKKTGMNALNLFPVFFLALFLLVLMPAKNTPIKWETIKNIMTNIGEGIDAIIVNVQYLFSNNKTFSLAFAGYGTDGSLGGSISNSNEPQISVFGDKTKSPLYLIGNTSNHYNGKNWQRDLTKKPYEFGEEEYSLQYDELMRALDRSIYSKSECNEFIRSRVYKIKYEGIKTNSLFIPLNMNSVNSSKRIKLLKNDEDNLVLWKPLGVGFTYETDFIEIDYANEKMCNILRNLAWDDTKIQEKNPMLESQRAYIKENYMMLPETLPKRVYDLANEITAEYNTDYDKLRAIESYLSQYTYSMTPESCPESQDFIDHFLFESQSGYCTYFATAMAVLGRCEGIPTRYVQGFVTNESNKKNRTEIMLTGNNGHAWAEAYIDSIGWVPFDATPGYYEAAKKEWEKPQPLPDSSQTTKEEEKPVNETSIYEPGEINEEDNSTLPLVVQILIVISIFVLIFIIFILIRNFLRKTKYSKFTEYEKIKYLMKRSFFFGKLHNCCIEDGETLLGYGNRLNGRLNVANMTFDEICNLFQSIRFGSKSITNKDITFMENYTKELEKDYLSNCQKYKRIFYYIR